MPPYSNDIRKSVLNARKEGITVKKIVSIFEVKKSAVYRWINMYKTTGNYKPLPQNAGRKSDVTNEQLELIKTTIIDRPDITLEELKEELEISVCISALCRIINNKLKLKYKKKRSMRSNKIEKT